MMIPAATSSLTGSAASMNVDGNSSLASLAAGLWQVIHLSRAHGRIQSSAHPCANGCKYAEQGFRPCGPDGCVETGGSK